MKTIYFNYIEYIIGQAVDAIFEQDFYHAYKVRFTEIKENAITYKDSYVFFQRLRESLKITLNNLERIKLFDFFFIEDLAPSDKNEDHKDKFVTFDLIVSSVYQVLEEDPLIATLEKIHTGMTDKDKNATPKGLKLGDEFIDEQGKKINEDI